MESRMECAVEGIIETQHVEALEILLQGLCGVPKERFRIHELCLKSGPNLATEDIEERLAGVPVYALSNSNEEFVLIYGVSIGKSLGLFYFNKQDVDSLLKQMKSMVPYRQKFDFLCDLEQSVPTWTVRHVGVP
ncbi:hypothetical protein IFM89_003308 [Coptis chinensis]|uniref:Uncharacterized protein n=1 Tax=Coptis chinensis TaxID=261450 RepID=A0A835IXT4_9MAGN|nr:hypothetical protein IFM89_003308 [Coptis chinensis]